MLEWFKNIFRKESKMSDAERLGEITAKSIDLQREKFSNLAKVIAGEIIEAAEKEAENGKDYVSTAELLSAYDFGDKLKNDTLIDLVVEEMLELGFGIDHGGISW